MSATNAEPTTCGISISELISEGGLECLNCGQWRLISSTGDVETCRDCHDGGWNLYEAADQIVP